MIVGSARCRVNHFRTIVAFVPMCSFLVLSAIAGAETWTYEVTVEKSPVPTDKESLRSEFDQLHISYDEVALNEAVQHRNGGVNETVVVTYQDNDGVIDGPIHSFDGMTGKINIHRFKIGTDYLATFIRSGDARGILEVQKRDNYRSVFSIIEERLLIGSGNIESRFRLFADNLERADEYNPFNHEFRLNGEDVSIMIGMREAFRVSFDKARSTLKISRYRSKNTLDEIREYRQVDALELEPLESIVDFGTPVIDSRLSEGMPFQYVWEGRMLSISELKGKPIDRGSRSEIPVFAIVGGVLVFFSLILCLVRIRGRKEPS